MLFSAKIRKDWIEICKYPNYFVPLQSILKVGWHVGYPFVALAADTFFVGRRGRNECAVGASIAACAEVVPSDAFLSEFWKNCYGVQVGNA